MPYPLFLVGVGWLPLTSYCYYYHSTKAILFYVSCGLNTAMRSVITMIPLILLLANYFLYFTLR